LGLFRRVYANLAGAELPRTHTSVGYDAIVANLRTPRGIGSKTNAGPKPKRGAGCGPPAVAKTKPAVEKRVVSIERGGRKKKKKNSGWFMPGR
jgi:hypothetical protein